MSKRDPERRRQWKEAVDRWRESGLSMRAFAAREGLSAQALRYWRHRFAEEPEVEFAPVKVVEPVVPRSAASEAPVFDVRFGDSTGIGVPAGFDEAELRRLISVVRSC